MTGSSCEPSQNVIPTEDLKGPSGGICGVDLAKRTAAISIDPSTRSLRSLPRDDMVWGSSLPRDDTVWDSSLPRDDTVWNSSLPRDDTGVGPLARSG